MEKKRENKMIIKPSTLLRNDYGKVSGEMIEDRQFRE